MKILSEQTDDQHGITLSELKKALLFYGIQAERKSLYDDIESLRLYGIDVEFRKSKSFEYYIANRAFELPELKLLVDAVQSSKFITHKKSNELIKKLENLASVHQAQLLQRQVFVSNRIKTMNESIYYNVDKIHTALNENKKINFQYFEWAVDFGGTEKVIKKLRHNGEKYRISPISLAWDDENYYLIGFDSNAKIVKHFRVDKMKNITLQNESRDAECSSERFDLAIYSKKTFGMFGGQEENVKLSFKNDLIGVVVDRFGKDIFITKNDDDSFIISVKVMISQQFLAWVFSFGDNVKIIEPQKVIDQYKTKIAEILKEYK
ncbi:MAG: WYL domain-containing protein [Bacillota bacterium]|nr:WYL domain-containing protein [Bacillota bacterium]